MLLRTFKVLLTCFHEALRKQFQKGKKLL